MPPPVFALFAGGCLARESATRFQFLRGVIPSCERIVRPTRKAAGSGAFHFGHVAAAAAAVDRTVALDRRHVPERKDP